MKRLISRLSILACLLAPSLGFAATLTLSPSSSSVSVGNNFTVTINLNTSGAATYGVDINKIRFNPSLLQVVDSDTTISGVQISKGSLMSVTTTNTADNAAGTIQFSQLANFGSTYNGSGTLATITFKALAAGTAAVTIDFTSGSGTDSNVAGLGSDLLTSVSNGSYTLTSIDSTPPTISSVTSSGVSSSGATVAWVTNEASDTQVEYGLTTAYGQLSSLNPAMVISHTAVLSGLNPNTLYNYRVKSKDAAGNLAVSANQTLTTSAGGDTTPPTVPVGLTSFGVTTSQATLSWGISTDPSASGQTSSGVAGYRVYRDNILVSSQAGTSYSDSGLNSSTSYSYQVASYDNAGNASNKSAALLVTTSAATPIQRKFTFSLEGVPFNQRIVNGTVQYLNTSNVLLNQNSGTTDSTGSITFTLPLGLPSSINIRFIASDYLSRIISSVDTTSTSLLTVTSPALPAGDFNDDQLVNTLDFSTMNSNWLSSNITSDINKDGIVNSLDFAFLSNNWLQIGQ